jgi:hypothetical protein
MEKLVDTHIKDGVLKEYLCIKTNMLTKLKSTETALHNVVTCIQSAIEHKEIALGAFLDIEGVSDRIQFDIITLAASRHGNEPTICWCIYSMLESRNI